jgi:hypothetical protein
MDKEKKHFLIGVQVGIELQRMTEEEREQLGKKHFTMLDWETEWINETYNELKINRPELFDTEQIND